VSTTDVKRVAETGLKQFQDPPTEVLQTYGVHRKKKANRIKGKKGKGAYSFL